MGHKRWKLGETSASSDFLATGPGATAPAICDRSGYPVFSEGSSGRAHILAHTYLDEDRFSDGHRYLGSWLRARRGTDSQWVHLQWHMLVFELALGEGEEALDRFHTEVEPAVRAGAALTDGPSALWRLTLARAIPRSPSLWRGVRDAALAGKSTEDSAFQTLHHMLAFAGAEDIASLQRVIRELRGRDPDESDEHGLLRVIGNGLLAFARHDFEEAHRWLSSALPGRAKLGGSHAQLRLLVELDRESRYRCDNLRLKPNPESALLLLSRHRSRPLLAEDGEERL